MRSRTAQNRSLVLGTANSDRRQLSRLRDLCDEVLASFRLAAGQDPISDQDRQVAMELMPALIPVRRR
jgi:hypothetical protein